MNDIAPMNLNTILHSRTIGLGCLVFLSFMKFANSLSTLWYAPAPLSPSTMLRFQNHKRQYSNPFHVTSVDQRSFLNVRKGMKQSCSTSNNSITRRLGTTAASDSDPATDDSNPSDGNSSTLRDRLLKISNAASLLCVIDCTVLPIVTILLPLLGLGVAASYTTLNARLHYIGHQMALYFVLPVGGFAMIMNYLKHTKKRLLLLSSLGMSLVYLANAGRHSPILALFPPKIAHDLHCGTTLHRLVNIVGCVCLLSSNYVGGKISASRCGGVGHHLHKQSSCCDRNHDHGPS
jgi:hypothetical protein